MKSGAIADDDPIGHVADALAEEAWLLCFDEFHVTDIADAMILGRLFTRLFERGVVVVATSNVEPDELYKDGLNRALFLPFIALLREHMEVVRLAGAEGLPAGEARRAAGVVRAGGRGRRGRARHCVAAPDRHAVGRALRDRRQGARHPRAGGRQGRRALLVPPAVRAAARRERLSAHRARIPHLILERIPVMDYPQRNEAKRFIALIDTLYDNAVKLVASAAAEPTALYLATDGYEANEFKRTASRLIEMRSNEYLALPHGHNVRGASARPRASSKPESSRARRSATSGMRLMRIAARRVAASQRRIHLGMPTQLLA